MRSRVALLTGHPSCLTHSLVTARRTKWRLVEGIVQRSNATEDTTDATQEGEVVEVMEVGTFGANEFEEALLTSMQRFQE